MQCTNTLIHTNNLIMIRLEQVEFKYKKQKRLIDNLDLELRSNSICGLLGKNGAGKTTLLRLITGAIWSQNGYVFFNDETIRNRNVDQLSDIYFLQEDFELPKYSIERYRDVYSSFYPKFSSDKFWEILGEMEVDSKKPLKALSFGQKKKVHLAFALATNVKLLILDEPTNGLDIPSKAIFRKIIAQYVGEEQSVIISTHQIRDLGQVLDRIIILEEGNIILNENLFDLATSYKSNLVSGQAPSDKFLFNQQVLGGWHALSTNESGDPGDLDLELFFNAVISDVSILKHKKS